jgi:hypothetical protein
MGKIVRLTDIDLTRIIKRVINEENSDLINNKIKSIVKKFGFEKASEMVVGGADTIRQVLYNNDPYEFLNQFNNLIPVKSKFPDLTFYVNNRGKVLLYHFSDKITNAAVHYDTIYHVLFKLFGLHSNEIQKILNNWLENTYNIVLTYHKSYNEMKPSFFTDKMLAQLKTELRGNLY